MISHNTSPVSWSNARNRPFTSPPNTSPPPVATSNMVAERCEWNQRVSPVSAEISSASRRPRARRQSSFAPSMLPKRTRARRAASRLGTPARTNSSVQASR